MAPDAQDVVNRTFEALNAHDAARVRTFYTDDCEVSSPAGEMRGADAVVALAQTYWNAFSDLKWSIKHQCTSGDTVVTEEFAEGTNDGGLVTPQGTLPASNKRVITRICEVSRVRGDKIYSLHLYWDNLAFLQAINALPAP
jgi:steroid delta-isomerase-like uncharacterized protein